MSDIVIGLTLRADGKGFVGEVKSVRGELQQLGITAKRSGADLNDLGSRADRALAPLRSLQATLAGLGVAIAAKRAVQEFAEYERGLVGVAKTADLTAAQVKEMGTAVTEMARRMPFARTELLAIAQAGGQLGVKGVRDLTLFAETIAKLGTASDLAGEEAATSLTRILNVSRESIDRIDELASVIVALGNNFAASESEITRVATQVSQAVAAFKVSSEQSAALGAALRSIGVQAELGGSAVGKAFRSIESAIRGGGEQMGELSKLTGLTGEQLRQTFATDATEVFKLFVEGLGRAVEGGASAAEMLERFGLQGDEILKVLPTLALNSGLLGKALALSAKEAANATALNEEYLRASTTLSSQLKLASNAIDEIAAGFGQALAPQIVQATKDLREFVQASIDSGEAAEWFETVAGAVALLSGNMDVLASLMTGRVGASVGAAIGSIFGPLGTAVGTVAGAVVGFGAGMVAMDRDLRAAIPGLRSLGTETERTGEVMATALAGGRAEVEATTASFIKPGGLLDVVGRAATAFEEFAKRDLAENPISENWVNKVVVDGTIGVIEGAANTIYGAARAVIEGGLTLLNEPFEVLASEEIHHKLDEVILRNLTTKWVSVYFGAATEEGRAEIRAMGQAWQGEMDSIDLSLPDESRPRPGIRTPVDTGLPAEVKAILEQLDPFTKMLREAGNAEALLTANQDKLKASGKDLYGLLAQLDRQLDAYKLGLEAAGQAVEDQAADLALQGKLRLLESEGTEAARKKILELTAARELERLEVQRQQALAAAQPGQLKAIEAAFGSLRAAIIANRDAQKTWSTTQATALKAAREQLDPVAAATRKFAELQALLNDALGAGQLELVDHATLTAALRREQDLWKRSLGEAARQVRDQARDLELSNQVRRLELEDTEAARERIIELTQARKLEQLEIERTQALLAAQPDQIAAVNAAYDELKRAIMDEGQVRELQRIRDQANPMAEAFKNAAQGIQRGFADAFTSIIRNGKLSLSSLADSAKDIFARMLGEIATLAIARPIIVPIVSGLGSALGLDQVAINSVTRNLGGGAGGAAGGAPAGLSFFDTLSLARLGGGFLGGQSGSQLGTSLLSGSVGQFLGAPQAAQAGSIALGDIAIMAPGQMGGFGLLETGLNNLGDPLTGLAGFGGNLGANLLLGGNRGVGSTIGGTIGGLAGGFFGGPLGALAGSFAGNAIGGLFGGKRPSVGPTTIGRVTDLTDPDAAVVTFDNKGNNEDEVRRIIEAIADSIEVQTRRYGATLRPGSGFDVGYFPDPDSESSQGAGVNLKAIVGNLLEDKDRFKGLSEEDAVAKATLIAMQDMVAYQNETLQAIADGSTTEDLAEFVGHLEFGRNLVDLRDALTRNGGSLDANTLAVAQAEVAAKRAAEARAEAGASPILASIETALELFPKITPDGTVGSAAKAAVNEQAVADVVTFAQVSVDQLIGTLTGDFVPTLQGPVTTAFEATAAEIEALGPWLESMNDEIRKANEEYPTLNAALIDVTATLTDARQAAEDFARAKFEEGLTATENTVRGRGAINGLSGLIEGRDKTLADAARFGVDAADRIMDTFGEQVRGQLGGLDGLGLAEALKQTTDEATRAVIGSMLDELYAADRDIQVAAKRDVVTAAYERESQALTDLAERMRSFATTIGDFVAQLKRGELAPGGPVSRYEEARRQFDETYRRAQLGDEKAITDLTAVAQAFLEASDVVNGDRDAYNADFGLTVDRLESVKSLAERQADVADRQLAELRTQVGQFVELNDNVISVEEAIRDLQSVAGTGLAALLEAARRPSDVAAARGYQFGQNAETNKGIYDDLVRLGLPTPDGFGPNVANNIGELRRRNPAVDAYLRSRSLEVGGSVATGELVRVHNNELLYTGPAAHVFTASESAALMRAGRSDRGDNVIDLAPVVAAAHATTAAVRDAGDAQVQMMAAMVARIDGLSATVAAQARTIDDLNRLLMKRAS